MNDQTNEQNKRIFEALGLVHRGTYRRCLFSDDCAARTVNAHSVSHAILSTIQDYDHVIAADIKYRKDEDGRSRPHMGFETVGIRQASIGTFACQTHEDAFKPIDTVPMDFEDPNIRNMLLYRAILREMWNLLRTRDHGDWVDEKAPFLYNPTVHPKQRLQSLSHFRDCVKSLMAEGESFGYKPQVMHLVRRVKSKSPILAASGASGGSVIGTAKATGARLSDEYLRTHVGVEPNTSWGLTIVPQKNEHIVLFSWLEGSQAEHYFRHLRTVQGKELEAAVSAELIVFCENWFLAPKVWAAYRTKKQEAIRTAYDNISELLSHRYGWVDKDDKATWYEYLELSNRHQLNLFRYD